MIAGLVNVMLSFKFHSLELFSDLDGNLDLIVRLITSTEIFHLPELGHSFHIHGVTLFLESPRMNKPNCCFISRLTVFLLLISRNYFIIQTLSFNSIYSDRLGVSDFSPMSLLMCIIYLVRGYSEILRRLFGDFDP